MVRYLGISNEDGSMDDELLDPFDWAPLIFIRVDVCAPHPNDLDCRDASIDCFLSELLDPSLPTNASTLHIRKGWLVSEGCYHWIIPQVMFQSHPRIAFLPLHTYPHNTEAIICRRLNHSGPHTPIMARALSSRKLQIGSQLDRVDTVD